VFLGADLVQLLGSTDRHQHKGRAKHREGAATISLPMGPVVGAMCPLPLRVASHRRWPSSSNRVRKSQVASVEERIERGSEQEQ
jgi:hypothetical protein